MQLYQIKIEGSSREENKVDALLSAYTSKSINKIGLQS